MNDRVISFQIAILSSLNVFVCIVYIPYECVFDLHHTASAIIAQMADVPWDFLQPTILSQLIVQYMPTHLMHTHSCLACSHLSFVNLLSYQRPFFKHLV